MMMMETSDQTEQSRESRQREWLDKWIMQSTVNQQRIKVNNDVDKANNKHKHKKNEECKGKGSAEEARIYYYYIYMAVLQNSVVIDQSRRYGYAYRVTTATTAANANKHTKNS